MVYGGAEHKTQGYSKTECSCSVRNKQEAVCLVQQCRGSHRGGGRVEHVEPPRRHPTSPQLKTLFIPFSCCTGFSFGAKPLT